MGNLLLLSLESECFGKRARCGTGERFGALISVRGRRLAATPDAHDRGAAAGRRYPWWTPV